MTLLLPRLAVLAALCLSAGPFSVSPFSVSPLAAQPLPWADAFDDGDRAGWTVVQDRYGSAPVRSGPPSWLVADGSLDGTAGDSGAGGVLRQTSNVWVGDPPLEFELHLGTHVAAGDDAWTDYALNVTARSDDNDGLGVLVRYQSPTRYVRFLLMQDPANGGPIRKLERRDGDAVTLLAEDRPARALPADPFTLTVDVRGDSVYAFVDAEPIFAVRDAAIPAAGRVGLSVYANSGAYFDDVAVTEERFVRTPPPPPPPPARLPYVQRPTPTSMTIAWRTPAPTRGVVQYGPTPALGFKREGEQRTTDHAMTLDGLTAGQTVYYRVTADDAPFSEVAAFRTPAPGDSTLRLLVFGDSGTGGPAQEAVRDAMHAAALDPAGGPPRVDLGLHVGDVHQGQGDAYDAVYFQPYADLIARVPMMVSIGNHDTYHDDAATYLDDFVLPTATPGGTERYYAFSYGPLRAVALDSNIPFTPGSAQHAWFADELQSAAFQAATWRLVYFHHPPYCQAWSGWAGDPDVRTHLMPLFETYGVDLVLNGHTHAYERGALNGVFYVITGGGGGGLDDFGRNVGHLDVTVLAHHYTLIDIDGGTLTLRAITPEGTVLDEVVRTKATGTDAEAPALPQGVRLEPAYPNPLARGDTARFRLTTDAPGTFTVAVFDALGRRVAVLHDGPLAARTHPLAWTPPPGLAAGAYFLHVQTDRVLRTVPLTLAD